MGDDLQDLIERCMALRLRAEALASGIEAATTDRQECLLRLPRLHRLWDRTLRRAAGRQAVALHLAEQLHALRGRLTALQREAETQAFSGADVGSIQADLRHAQEIIAAWEVVPDPAEPGDDKGEAP